jgi:hypothetical protein
VLKLDFTAHGKMESLSEFGLLSGEEILETNTKGGRENISFSLVSVGNPQQ